MKKVIFLLLGIILLTSGCVYSNNTTDVDTLTSAPVVNNTNIGCYGGESGTCERVNGTTYNASNYSMNVYVKYHVVNNNAHTVFYVYINGTVVLWRDFTTVQADQNESFAFNIPKGANFSYYNNSAIHHVEWREYPILSGQNGTLSINQTIIGGSNYNASYVPYTGATTDLDMGSKNITSRNITVTTNLTAINATIGNITATNVSAIKYNILDTQTVYVTKSFGTVYQNSGTRIRVVAVGGYSVTNSISMVVYTDSSNPPITAVASVHSPAGGLIGEVFFLVLPGNYYKITTTGAGATVNTWVEWS